MTEEITTIKVKMVSRTDLKILAAQEKLTMQEMLQKMIENYKNTKGDTRYENSRVRSY